MRMYDVRTKLLNASLDRPLRAQPRRDRGNMHSVRDCVDNGCAEPAPMRASHDEHDVMLGCLKARELRGIAFGAGEAAGKDDVHDAHIRYILSAKASARRAARKNSFHLVMDVEAGEVAPF